MQIAMNDRPTPVIMFLVMACCSLAPIASADPPPSRALTSWTIARADSGASGAIKRTLPTNLRLLWETETAEAIETTPVSNGKLIFVDDVMGGVEALDLVTGRSKWRREFDTGFVASPGLFLPGSVNPDKLGSISPIPVVANAETAPGTPQNREMLVVGDVEGNIHALDSFSGETVWTYSTEGEISASPAFFAVPRGEKFKIRVLQSSQDGSLYCLDAADGRLVWKYQTDDQIRCSPSIAAGKTFLGGCDGQLHVIDLATGKAAREPIPLGGPTGSTPAVGGDEVFLPIMDGTVFAFNPSSGDVLWRYEDPDRPQEYRSSAAIGANLVIISSQNKHIDALDRKLGTHVWRKTLRRRADASPLIAGDDVWIAATDGLLLRLSLADGEEKWSFESRGKFMAAPAIVGNRLIIADDDGVVRCFGP